MLAEDDSGESVLGLALDFIPGRSAVAAAILAASPVDAALAALCSADTDLALQLLPSYIAKHFPLTSSQWALIPSPQPGLGSVLPVALASSVSQARQLLRRLPPATAQRLRTFALCVARLQRTMPASWSERNPLWPQYLPQSCSASCPSSTAHRCKASSFMSCTCSFTLASVH